MLLSPRTIGPEVIEQFIRQHSELDNTIFLPSIMNYSLWQKSASIIDKRDSFCPESALPF